MTVNEAQANPNTILGIMIVFSIPIQVLFYSRSSKLFVSTSFTLHTNQKLTPLKHKLVVMTPFGRIDSTYFSVKRLQNLNRESHIKGKFDPFRDVGFRCNFRYELVIYS